MKEEMERGKSSKGKRPLKGNLEHGITREPADASLSGDESLDKRTSSSPAQSSTSKAYSEAAEPKNIFTVMTRGGRVAKRISLTKGETDNSSSKSVSENDVSDDSKEQSKGKTPVLRHSKKDFETPKEKPGHCVRNTPKNQDDSISVTDKHVNKDSILTDKSTPVGVKDKKTPKTSRLDRKRKGSESANAESSSKKDYRRNRNRVRNDSQSSEIDVECSDKKQRLSENEDVLDVESVIPQCDEKSSVAICPKQNRSGPVKKRHSKRWSDYNNRRMPFRDRHGKFSGKSVKHESDASKESFSSVPNGVVQNSKFVVGQSIKEKVQSKLHQARLKASLTNGVHNAVEKLVKREVSSDSDSKTLEYIDTDLLQNRKDSDEIKTLGKENISKLACKTEKESEIKTEIDSENDSDQKNDNTNVNNVNDFCKNNKETEQSEKTEEEIKDKFEPTSKEKSEMAETSPRKIPAAGIECANETNSEVKTDGKPTKSTVTPHKTKSSSNIKHNNIASLSPTGLLGGYRIPKKTPDSQSKNDIEHRTPLGKRPLLEETSVTSISDSPETRSVKRRIDMDLDSNASENVFDNLDGEISIRSSRSTTPDRELGPVRRSGRHSLARQVANKLQGDIQSKTNSLASNSDIDSDNDVALSDLNNLPEAGNSQSSSNSNCSNKSRVSDQWSRSLRTVSS